MEHRGWNRTNITSSGNNKIKVWGTENEKCFGAIKLFIAILNFSFLLLVKLLNLISLPLQVIYFFRQHDSFSLLFAIALKSEKEQKMVLYQLLEEKWRMNICKATEKRVNYLSCIEGIGGIKVICCSS